MKRRFIVILLLAFSLLIGCSPSEDFSYAKRVNTFIGTENGGNVYPGASAPFGMVQLSPDNGLSGWYRIAGYHYPDTTIAGFSMTHLSGTGAGDLYDISFMPATAPLRIGAGELGVYSSFKHASEESYAGYYSVLLDTYDIKVELTATERCGVQRYTFPESDEAVVILNLKKTMNWDALTKAEIKVIDNKTIAGYRYSTGWATDQRVYFYTEFSEPFIECSIIDSIARFEWKTTKGKQITVKTAISATSAEGAKRNFSEVEGRSFDEIQRATTAQWNRDLSCIEIEGATPDEETIFYTALYRTMLAPTIYNDVDGAYRGGDLEIHKGDFTNYSTFSLWDTYRTAHPLLTITNPHRIEGIVESLLSFYDESGALPVWNMWSTETDMMIGYHSVPVIVEAYLKGVKMDAQRALAACVATASQTGYRGIGDYMAIGYVPADEGESVSKTIEYAYDDHCIALMAEAMGEDAIAEEFYARANNFKNIFKDGFFQPRGKDGEFLENFDAKEYTHHITESNGWQYRFGAQHDIPAMIALMGGEEFFEMALDSMFTYYPTPSDSLPIFSTGMIGQYAHGNEPSHHIAYLYNYIGKPQKSAHYADTIMRTQYSNTPAGLCGNEDCGQMSAWYVMSALGFYSVDPASLEYALGSPLFPKATIKLPNNKQFIVERNGNGRLPKSYTLNGEELERPFITWSDIISGGTLIFNY
ncbi:MAG: GH92 family glycosyl hydrolase [Rikenellaceae bacterium]